MIEGSLTMATMNTHNSDSSPLDWEIEAYKRDVDRSLLRENLKLTVEQRLLQLIDQARLADEFDRDRIRQKRS